MSWSTPCEFDSAIEMMVDFVAQWLERSPLKRVLSGRRPEFIFLHFLAQDCFSRIFFDFSSGQI
jgi:hypothetical protein